jgi:hypothetical protein
LVFRFAWPAEEEARIHAVIVALKRADELVWLKATRNPDEQMLHDHRRSAHALDNEIFSVPSFQPEFLVLPAAVAAKVQE